MVLQVLTYAGQVVRNRDCSRWRRAAGPIAESCNSLRPSRSASGGEGCVSSRSSENGGSHCEVLDAVRRCVVEP